MPTLKVLDSSGLEYLWSKINMQDYPNNEILAGVINAIQAELEDIRQSHYPIGSIYISVNDINPESTLGFGTWEQIKDTFLLAAGDTYAAGSVGGESEHTLTIDEMPHHSHTIKTDIESEDFNTTWPEYYEYTEGWIQGPAYETESPPNYTTFTGGGLSHNNMPPYLSVYVWQRIS